VNNRQRLSQVLEALGIPQERIVAALPCLLGGELPGTSPALLNMKEACAYLGGISRWTIQRAVNAGDLPCVHIGTRILFRPIDLDAFAEPRSRTMVTPPAQP